MKPAKANVATLIVACVCNRKRLWANFLIGTILIFNIISHLFVFTIYKTTYQSDIFTFGHSSVLLIIAITPFLLALMVIRWRTDDRRKQELQKNKIEKEMLQLEVKALRAQMNPHFIFNCMNSIKLLIQQKELDKAITYLTIFSKLIRTIFQNADKKEVTLYEEIETCRLYTQLENMRLGNKLSCILSVDESIDLKSILVPELILQPFIENAIWHGIMPKQEGGMLHLDVLKKEDKIYCVVEDNGIGRKQSMQDKFIGTPSAHQSNGVFLTQSRLALNNIFNRRNATIEIIDKTNDAGEAEGTKVILVFNEE